MDELSTSNSRWGCTDSENPPSLKSINLNATDVGIGVGVMVGSGMFVGGREGAAVAVG
jgi:hypothetical protein